MWCAELASRNVAVSVICPGYVRTSLSLNAVDAKGGKYGQMDENTAKVARPLARLAVGRNEQAVCRVIWHFGAEAFHTIAKGQRRRRGQGKGPAVDGVAGLRCRRC